MSARRTLPLIAALLAAVLAPPASGAAERPARGTAPATSAPSRSAASVDATTTRRPGGTAAPAAAAAPIPRATASPRRDAIPRSRGQSAGQNLSHGAASDVRAPAEARPRGTGMSPGTSAARPRADMSSGTPAAHRPRTDLASGTAVSHRPATSRPRTDMSPGTPVSHRPATSRARTDMSPGTAVAHRPATSRARTDMSPGTASTRPTDAHARRDRSRPADLAPADGVERRDATDAAREVLAVPAAGDLSRKPSTSRRARNAAEDALRRSGLDVDADLGLDDGAPSEPAPPRARKADRPAPAPAPTDMPQKPAARARARQVPANMSPETDTRAPRGQVPTTPAACAAALEAAPVQQYERTRTVMREFWWSDMARFFETSLDEAEPLPTEVSGPDTLPADEAIRRSGLARKPLEALARARAVDLLSERDLARLDKTLHGAAPAALRALLRADSPSLRAHVWTWLATTPSGVCALFRLDRAEVEAAIHDRSIAVEHGEDLIFRPLGDYALAARSRLAAPDPQNFDALLRALWDDTALDPRLRAMIAGLRVRRGHADSIEPALRDPVASVRAAVAAAALDRDRERYELRVLDHAAADPADLVTELIVGELLGGPDSAPRGALATSRDPRIVTALARWKGRGDPMAPLPAPEHPLRFAKPKRHATPTAEPTEPEPTAPPRRDPAPTERQPPREPEQPRRDPSPADLEDAPSLPGIFDDPSAH